MKLLADECCAASLVQLLRPAGHDVVWVGEGGGIEDEEVLAAAYREGRFVITDDKDFGELVVRQKRPAVGLILLRVAPGAAGVGDRLVRLLALSEAEIRGRLVVVSERKVRFRWL